MSKKYVLFALITVIMSAAAGVLLVELGLRIIDRSPVKSTWLEMHERGFMMNRAHTDGLHTFNDIRVRYELSPERSRGEPVDEAHTNIWVFGDSFTFGLLLPEADTFVSRMNMKIAAHAPDSDIRFINAGVGGTGLADWLAFLETYGEKLPIDGILLMHNYDDFARTLAKNLYVADGAGGLQESRRWRERGIKRTLDESRLWKLLQENFRLFSYVQSLLWSTLYFEDLFEASDEVINPFAGLGTLDEYHAYALEVVPQIYERLLRLSQRRQVPLWVSTTGFIGKEQADEVNELVFDALPDMLEEAGIYYDDITPHLHEKIAGNYDQIRIPGDTHPNRKGAALIGELLWERSSAVIMNDVNQPSE